MNCSSVEMSLVFSSLTVGVFSSMKDVVYGTEVVSSLEVASVRVRSRCNTASVNESSCITEKF